ncbi:hypothetical protein N7513_006560 [Penicillium frequentans]|nr:hypothetical protein N7513_006560 [Penicillium glabrum]
MGSVDAVFGQAPSGIDLSENQAHKITGAISAMLALSIIGVSLRIYSRLVVKRVVLGLDDWTIIVAQILVVGLFAATILAEDSGVGKHIWAGTMDDVVQLQRNLWAYAFVYIACLVLVKSSIISFYRRIFNMNWALWACLFIVIGWGIGSLITLLVACRPISYFWNWYIDPDGGKCLFDLYYFYIGNAVANVATDGLILMIPMLIVWKLQMQNFQKLLVCGIFFIGGVAIIVSIIRISSIMSLKTSLDVSWVMGGVYMWSQIEISVAVICACLPTLQPIICMWATNLTSSRGAKPSGENSLFQQLSRKKRSTRNRPVNFRPDCDEAMLTCSSVRVEMDTLPKDRDSDLENDTNVMSIKVQREFHMREDSCG